MDAEQQGVPESENDQSLTCPGCGAVYDRRYLTECCRYEAGQGYRCPACNHFLEREGGS